MGLDWLAILMFVGFFLILITQLLHQFYFPLLL